MIVLENRHCKLSLAEPGERYRGARFDWTGFVTDWTFRGRHSLLSAESREPGVGMGGLGLCGEFAMMAGIGYDDCPVGGWFPKPGVGLLRRTDDPSYLFSRAHELRPFPMSVRREGDTVVYRCDPLPERGYAFATTRRFRLEDGALVMEVAFENRGEKPVRSHEYNHNFLLFDGRPLGDAYRLDLNVDCAFGNVAGSVRPQARRLAWPPEVCDGFFCEDLRVPRIMDASWTLSHATTGMALRETLTGLPLIKAAVWGHRNCVSPELFGEFEAAPGAVCKWRRTWAVSCPGDDGPVMPKSTQPCRLSKRQADDRIPDDAL